MAPDKNIYENVEHIVDKLLKDHNKYSQESIKNYNKLNQIIYDVYELSKDEVKIIEKCLSEVMSGKQWQRQ